ncbi:MAG: AAA family ATPase [Candidatus Dormibacteria bacterium]
MTTDPRVNSYRRHAAAITAEPVLHPLQKRAAIDANPFWKRGQERARLEAEWAQVEDRAIRAADSVLSRYEDVIESLNTALAKLAALKRQRLFGKVEDEQAHLQAARVKMHQARVALTSGDFGAAGKVLQEAERDLFGLGGDLMLALNQELGQAAFSREKKAALQAALDARREAQVRMQQARETSLSAGLLAAVEVYDTTAQGLARAAEILSEQVRASTRRNVPSDGGARVVAPHELETFDDVGGMDEVKARLRNTMGMILERGAEASRLSVQHNGILLYGPPGTGKTLLARALAGEYGMRFVRFSPSVVASAYAHQPVQKLRELFELAASSAPCVLFLDEVELIGGRRDQANSIEEREVTTQLMNSLEEYRSVPGLVIMAATNSIDGIDPALREGRFDSRIAVPLPDVVARRKILDVHLRKRSTDVDWPTINLDELAQRTSGRSGAALAGLVTAAAEGAAMRAGLIAQADVLKALDDRGGQDRSQTFEESVRWSEVILPRATQERLEEILLVFQQPELGRSLGVQPPAGILLFGPPGTGKTTVAKALATEVRASFYEQSAADLLSKYVGESEDRVARLFSRARDNRPSIIFIDEVDALLKRRSADSGAPWEERVVSQFLRELDGLGSAAGVLLVGATNRLDIIDEAVRERRLVAIEVPLPDGAGRRKLLELLCREVRLDRNVDLGEIAEMSEGMSGADLKAIRNAAGMKALTRAAKEGGGTEASVGREDFSAALTERGMVLTPD